MTQNVGIVIVEYEIKEIGRKVNGERGRTMDTHKFFVEKMRFHLKEQDMLVFVGWFFDGNTKEHSIKAYLDNRELPLTVQVNRGAEVRQKYIRSINEIEEEVVGIIKLPPDWRNGRRVTLMAAYREEYKKSYPPEVRNSMPVFLKVENAIYTKEKERQDILNIIEQQKKDKEEYQKAYISVYQILYEGTTIAINNAMYSGDTRKNVMLRNVAGRIVIQQTKEKME